MFCFPFFFFYSSRRRNDRLMTMQDLAKETLKISAGGLERRGYDEVGFLDKLHSIANRGTNQAEELQSKYTEIWDGKVDPIFHPIHQFI